MNELVKASAATSVMPLADIQRDPSANTEALLSWLQRHGSTVSIKTRLTFPVDPKTGEQKGWRETVTGAELSLMPSANPVAALAMVDRSLAPAPEGDIRAWLAELSVVTARRSESEEEGMLTLSAYTARLVQYPGDIVRDTVKSWDGKWFPTWGELKEILDARSAPRLAIRDAFVGRMPQAQTKPDLSTPAERTKRRNHLQWSLERVRTGRPFPEHRDLYAQSVSDLVAKLEDELRELNAMEG